MYRPSDEIDGKIEIIPHSSSFNSNMSCPTCPSGCDTCVHAVINIDHDTGEDTFPICITIRGNEYRIIIRHGNGEEEFMKSLVNGFTLLHFMWELDGIVIPNESDMFLDITCKIDDILVSLSAPASAA